MNCPQCGLKKKLKIIDTRTTPENYVMRKRACYACSYVFTTYEVRASEITLLKK